MNEIQKIKRNFRNTKAFKLHKEKKKKECGGIDKITNKKLRKGWSLHHEDLNEKHYKILNDYFLPCNNLTHKFIHWLWQYYVVDEGIIDRIKTEMERMRAINKGAETESRGRKKKRETRLKKIKTDNSLV